MLPPKTNLLLALHILLLISCNNNGEQKTVNSGKDTVIVKKEKKDLPKAEPGKKPPIINIVDTVQTRRIVVYMKDSVSSMDRISIKLGQIYGTKLAECFKKNVLKSTGAPMAWYSTNKTPYFFEAGIPVNKKPLKLTPGVYVKELRPDSAVIAHFYGPYDLIHVGYEVLNDWLKDHKKHATGTPYEIYVTDPLDKKGKPVDPYKIQTDIVFPRN
jgi:effector-binding domain-containing protein